MDKKVALITGAADKLRKAVTQKLLTQGVHIHATLSPLDDPNFLSSPELINAEFQGENVTSTVIAPSTIDTPGTRKTMPNADFSKWVTTEEIAGTIAFITTNAGRQPRQFLLPIYGRS